MIATHHLTTAAAVVAAATTAAERLLVHGLELALVHVEHVGQAEQVTYLLGEREQLAVSHNGLHLRCRLVLVVAG